MALRHECAMSNNELTDVQPMDTSSGLMVLSMEATISSISFYRSRTSPCPAVDACLSNIVSDCRLVKELLGRFTPPVEPASGSLSPRLFISGKSDANGDEFRILDEDIFAQALPDASSPGNGVMQSSLPLYQYGSSDVSIDVPASYEKNPLFPSNQHPPGADDPLSCPIGWNSPWFGPKEAQPAALRDNMTGIFNPKMSVEEIQSIQCGQQLEPPTPISNGQHEMSVYADDIQRSPNTATGTCCPSDVIANWIPEACSSVQMSPMSLDLGSLGSVPSDKAGSKRKCESEVDLSSAKRRKVSVEVTKVKLDGNESNFALDATKGKWMDDKGMSLGSQYNDSRRWSEVEVYVRQGRLGESITLRFDPGRRSNKWRGRCADGNDLSVPVKQLNRIVQSPCQSTVQANLLSRQSQKTRA